MKILILFFLLAIHGAVIDFHFDARPGSRGGGVHGTKFFDGDWNDKVSALNTWIRIMRVFDAIGRV